MTEVDSSDSILYLEERAGEEADDPVGPSAALAAVPHEHAPLLRRPTAVPELHRAR